MGSSISSIPHVHQIDQFSKQVAFVGAQSLAQESDLYRFGCVEEPGQPITEKLFIFTHVC